MAAKVIWQERELGRFASGQYKPLPWAKETWFTELKVDDPRKLHFAHISEKDPYVVAYTPSPDDGERDRRVPIKPGRYLQRYFADRLSVTGIAKFAALVRGDGLHVKYTDNPDIILKVYGSGGMMACMSHSASHYPASHHNGGLHPVLAYLAGDLKLAYAVGEGARTIGRAWCWPEKKLYTRCYGDTPAMKRALEAEGYTYGLLDGAKLRLVPLRGQTDMFTAPFVDHIKWARKDAAALVLQSKATGATHSVQHGDGIAYPIANAPGRPAGMSGESIAKEWARLVALEAGKPLTADPKEKKMADDGGALMRIAQAAQGVFGVVPPDWANNVQVQTILVDERAQYQGYQQALQNVMGAVEQAAIQEALHQAREIDRRAGEQAVQYLIDIGRR